MNPASIKPISAVQPNAGSALSKSLTPPPADTSTQARPASTQAEKTQPEPQAQPSEANSLANVSIRFQMDEKTNNVTIFLVDRRTRKVLRSIPASELRKMQLGDLLKLTA